MKTFLLVLVGLVSTYWLAEAIACTPQQIQSAVDVAKDVNQIAKVLCLLDQAKARGARADLVQDACATVEALGPYLPAAHRMQANPRAFVVQQ